MNRARLNSKASLVSVPLVGLVVAVGCSSSTPSGTFGEGTPEGSKITPGSLVAVSMSSQVGVLLDEIPVAIRDRVAQAIVKRPAAFWVARAHRQLALSTYRLVFREAFYGGGKGSTKPGTKLQLPLPPESLWNVTLAGAPRRASVDGHDLVLVDYGFTSTLLSDFDSPGISEPNLQNVGGQWSEPFTFPVDPELVFQRTRYACMDEAEFPPLSVDSEEVDSFYDHTCGVEKNLSNSGCHQTELPATSCVDALKAKIGHVDAKLKFERIAWSAASADAARVGPITSTVGADLKPEESEFRVNRVTYRYIAPDDCAIAEKCVGGTGWRKLLQFATADRNTGNKTLDIGTVDYFVSTDAGTTLSQHNVFEFSACHHHYHFTHYGTFSFAGNSALTTKRGFCLQSTNRFSNNEDSPLHNAFADCGHQGVEVGWVDEYKAGLPCQWIDVTGVAPAKGQLKFVSNPDGFICEGTPVMDDQGNQVYEPTSFTSSSGQTVDRPKCDYSPGWLDNNTDAYDVTLPQDGDGYVTQPCAHGQSGPLRNCGLQKQGNLASCTQGTNVTLRCTAAAGSAPQVTRVCEASRTLGSGLACTFQDALANVTVDAAGTDVSFTCPANRVSEPGGAYWLYTAPVFEDDAAQKVTCVLK